MAEAGLCNFVVDKGVAANLSDEPRSGENGHDWDRCACLLDLHAHLVFEVLWVVDGRLVKHENVAQSRTGEVNHQSEYPCDDVERDQLSPYVVSIPLAHICVFARLQAEVFR